MNSAFLAGALFALGCVAWTSNASATAILSPDTSTPTVSVGESAVVNVDITGVSDLYAFQFDLDFNPAVLSATSASEGAFLPTGGATFFIPGTIDNVGGSVAANADTLLTAISGVSGSGTLASFDFTAIGSGVSTLTLANVILLNSSLNSIGGTLQVGSITVPQASTIPEPATLRLLSLGLAGAVLMRRRRSS